LSKAEEEASQRVKEMAKELTEIRGDRDLAMERASKAERVLESGKELGGALREANERVAQVMGDLRNANAQIKELEEEIKRSDGRIRDLEKDSREYKNIVADLEEELSSRSDALAADRAKMKQLEDTNRKLDGDLTLKKNHMDEMATDLRKMESVSEKS
jgi:chromosome segregation ATPase